MSHEFYQIMVGAPSMSIHSWKQLALWSLEYSCLSSLEIEEGKRIFLESWQAFCNNVVDEYQELGVFEVDSDIFNNEKARTFYGLENVSKQ